MKKPTRYTLILPHADPRGPYTAKECRAEIEAANPGRAWHWRSEPQGAVAVSDFTGDKMTDGEILGEAVIID